MWYIYEMEEPEKIKQGENSPPAEGWPQVGVGKRTNKTPILTTINSTPIFRNFTPFLPANTRLRGRARSLRKAGNYPEVAFWMQVHKKKFHKIDFDRQRIIGNFIVDFYIKGLSLVIEIDGCSHNNKQIYDLKREEYLKGLGLKIYRISSLRVLHDLDNVLAELTAFIVIHYGEVLLIEKFRWRYVLFSGREILPSQNELEDTSPQEKNPPRLAGTPPEEGNKKT